MGMNLNIKYKIVMGSCITLVLLIILTFVSSRSIQSLVETSKLVEHTHQVLQNSFLIEKLIVDMETGERGFLISGKEEFLEPYETGKELLVSALAKTKVLVADNPEQVLKLNEIEQTINLWQEKAGIPEIEKRKEVVLNSNALSDFAKLHTRTVGKEIFDNIRYEFKVIRAEFEFEKNHQGIIVSLEAIKSLVDMETGQRGFLLTANEESLEPYINGQNNFEIHLEKLKIISEKSKGHRIIKRSLDRVIALVDEWIGKAAIPGIQARRVINSMPTSMDDVTFLIEEGTGKRIMDDLRAKIMMFRQVENELMAVRKIVAEREVFITETLIIFGTLVVIIISLFGSFWLAGSISKPINLLKRASMGIGKGVYPDKIYIDSKDEVAELGNAFEGMVDKIKSNEEALLLKKEEAERAQLAAESARTQAEVSKEEAEVAKKDAEKANLSKSVFLANMSHEIRTPLNAVLGYAQILKRDQSLNDEQYEAILTIDKSGKHLLGLINDILDISKIEAGKQELNVEEFDLGALMNELKSTFYAPCKEKQLVLEMEEYPEDKNLVIGDLVKLRQIFINLIGNAVKFTDTGSVECRFSKHENNNQYLFEVIDTGSGIPKDSQQDIFEPFRQDEEGLKKGGTGLGLAISHKQITQMGGKLELDSEPGKGSRFFFSLSFIHRKSRKTGATKKLDSKYDDVVGIKDEYKIKALVVDDVKENRDVLSLFLKSIGVDVTKAENGKIALEQLEKDLPHVIFMDIRMPVMDGVEAFEAIKKKYPDKDLKIVCITASTLRHHQEKYIEMGFDSYVPKPFRHSEVLEALETILNIEYTYKEHRRDKTIQELSEDIDWSKLQIPPEIKTEILKAADCYSITGLENSLSQLERIENGGKELGNILKKLVKKYDMEGIIEVMKKIS